MEKREEISSIHHYALRKAKDKYVKIAKVGSGAYGKVYKAFVKNNPKKLVALKKIEYKPVDYGFPITALREIKLLKNCQHPNVVTLYEIVTSKPSEYNNYHGSTFLVFEYMEHDFFTMMKNGVKFDPAQVKSIMKQVIEGTKYLHSRGIMHRDLKSANILMNNQGECKIADFGLGRYRNSPTDQYSNYVVTLWYRAPELLLGSRKYGFSVDMWSLGCIFAELLTGQILFKEQKEQGQFEKICEKCGNPSEADWPGVSQLKFFQDWVPKRIIPRVLTQHLREMKSNIDPNALDLIDKLLMLNPDKRISAQDALNHKYFHTDPLPLEPKDMPRFPEEYHDTLILHNKKNPKANGPLMDNGNKNIARPASGNKLPRGGFNERRGDRDDRGDRDRGDRGDRRGDDHNDRDRGKNRDRDGSRQDRDKNSKPRGDDRERRDRDKPQNTLLPETKLNSKASSISNDNEKKQDRMDNLPKPQEVRKNTNDYYMQSLAGILGGGGGGGGLAGALGGSGSGLAAALGGGGGANTNAADKPDKADRPAGGEPKTEKRKSEKSGNDITAFDDGGKKKKDLGEGTVTNINPTAAAETKPADPMPVETKPADMVPGEPQPAKEGPVAEEKK